MQFALPARDGTESKCVVKEVEISSKIPDDSLARSLHKLDISKESLCESLGICQMDWRTKISLEDDTTQEATTEGSLKVASYINLYTPASSLDSAYALLGGLDPQIKLVRSLLDLPLLHPELYVRFGLTPPRGILLYGPPGTGKTALARAVASSNPECSCIVVNGPELSSAFHGETEQRLRGVFEEARRRSPCIVVLDEVDALCPRRDGDGGEVEKRVVATLLTLMDGMGGVNERVFVIAATNRPNSVDPALRRPGRFDREIEIGKWTGGLCSSKRHSRRKRTKTYTANSSAEVATSVDGG